MRRAIAVLIITAMLLAVRGLAVQARPSAAGTVTLGASGWSDPSAGDWDQSTLTATLTHDLAAGIVIAADGVVLDGAGLALKGSGSGCGVCLSGRTGVTVKDLTVRGFGDGISLSGSHRNTLAGNTVSGNAYNGIYLDSSTGNVLTGNRVDGNRFDGIWLVYASGNTLRDNRAGGNSQHGLYMVSSNENVLTGNVMAGNGTDFRVDGWTSAEYRHTIDTSNLAGGRPILYVYGATGGTYDASSGAGSVYLVDCSGVTVRGLDLSGHHVGILLWGSSNSRLENLQATGNSTGIWLRYANDNAIVACTVRGNTYAGIHVEASSGNSLTGNTIQANAPYGLYLDQASNSRIYGNRLLGNATQAYAYGGSGNVYDLAAPIGGNYWDNWTTPNIKDDDGDGFVDSPYTFDYGQDNLPLAGEGPRDTVPPLTSLTLSGELGGDGWYRSEVRATLAAVDPQGGSGVACIEYSPDGASWTTYAGPVTLGDEGVTTFFYRSTDHAGNVAGAQSREIRIDRTAPTIGIAAPQPGALVEPGTVLSYGATDALSGLASLTGTLSDGATARPIASGEAVNEPGQYTLTVTAADVAGNTAGEARSFSVASTPGSGWITGGGWVSVDPGARGAAGRAFISIVCKPDKSARNCHVCPPIGEATLQAAGLKLKAKNFCWLAIEGNRAWCEGVATTHDGSAYGFLVAVAAGQTDRVRLKIWEQAGGTVVFDTQPGASDLAAPSVELGGGRLVVHQR